MKKLKQTLKVLTLSLCASSSLVMAAGEPPKMPAPKADAYVVPQAQVLPVILKYPAEIKSFQNVKVVSRVLGVLEEKHFTEGQKVKQGDLLYKIEDSIYKAKVDQASASVKINESALDNATHNWERARTLYDAKALSQEKEMRHSPLMNKLLAH